MTFSCVPNKRRVPVPFHASYGFKLLSEKGSVAMLKAIPGAMPAARGQQVGSFRRGSV